MADGYAAAQLVTGNLGRNPEHIKADQEAAQRRSEGYKTDALAAAAKYPEGDPMKERLLKIANG